MNEFGVVLLHGWAGEPGGSIAPLARALAHEGAKVTMPAMAWSASRRLDKGYEAALDEIDGAAAGLRAGGARRIVIAGHSFGANAALGYAARREGLAAVVVLAPGHTPERPGTRRRNAKSLVLARTRMAAGQGDVPVRFPDLGFAITPRIYLSYFDPDGPAVMPKNAAAMKPVALLWVVGTADPLRSLGRGYAFDRAPRTAASRYVEVRAGHFDTPAAAAPVVTAWLKSLLARSSGTASH